MKASLLSNAGKTRKRLMFGVCGLLLAAFGTKTIYAQTTGYVIGFQDVTVLNIPANTIAASIPAAPPQFLLDVAIAASPDGKRVYALYEQEGTVLVIDTATNAALTVLTNAGVAPLGLTVSPDSARVYVADQLNGVFIIDTATNTLEPTPIAVTGAPDSLAITPDGTRLYVGQEVGHSVSIVDTANNTVVGSPIPIGCVPFRMAITPDGTQVYVGCGSPGQVVAINTATNTVAATIPFDGLDFRLAVTPDGRKVYVSGLTAGSVGVIDTATNTLIATIPVGTSGSFPTGIAVTPDGAKVYVTLRTSGTATVIDTATDTVAVSGIPVGGGPQDLAIAVVNAPFAAFNIDKLNISSQGFHEQGDFTLGTNSQGIDPVHQPVTLTVGSFSLTIAPGKFVQVGGNSHFVLNDTINGLEVDFNLKASNGSSTAFSYVVNVHGVDLTAQPNPVTVSLQIGHNIGSTTAHF